MVTIQRNVQNMKPVQTSTGLICWTFPSAEHVTLHTFNFVGLKLKHEWPSRFVINARKMLQKSSSIFLQNVNVIASLSCYSKCPRLSGATFVVLLIQKENRNAVAYDCRDVTITLRHLKFKSHRVKVPSIMNEKKFSN